MSRQPQSLIGHIQKFRKGAAERDMRKKLKRQRRGMTQEEFQVRYDAQHGMCLIGGHKMDPPGGKSGRNSPCLDHSHMTGLDRGVICSRHNLALGLFADSPQEMEAAIVYLSHYPNRVRGRRAHHRIVQYTLPGMLR